MSQNITNTSNSQTINAPFRAKSAGVSLFAILTTGLYYLANATVLPAGTATIPDGAINLMIITVVFIIIIETVLQIVLFIGAGQIETPTERDTTIATQASRNAYIVLSGGVFATFASLFIGATSFEMSNILILTFLLAESIRFASQIFLYQQTAR